MNKLTALLVFCLMTPALATAQDDVSKRALAQELSRAFPQLENNLKSTINQYQMSASLSDLSTQTKPQPQVRTFMTAMTTANKSEIQARGLEKYTDELLELRLADPSMLARWQAGQSPLFAFEPEGAESEWQYIEAYDIDGNLHYLDVYDIPERPVLVVDTNNREELKAGLALMRDEFKALQSSGPSQQTKPAPYAMLRSAVEPTEINTTILKKIQLKDDHEPWISGKAEIYAIVSGVSPERDEPTIDVIEMPYLDYAEQSYPANQIMVFWDRYRWGAADIILMEQDDKTDYKQLAQTILKAASDFLATIPDKEAQAYLIIPQMTSAIIALLPDDLFVNDDDFVDVFYTIMKDTEYTDHSGAGNNATADFAPLIIQKTE
ncbi:DUF3103 domain-containing protein [Aliivibrio sp. S4TY2]|uniref:DUF3103 domain-containing protein n=1 Tax=unclassified Aliivibrio TaxID=2645654 RepID=UPI0023799299|nr:MULTISPECIES: DUF3103 domain-containing protein [unclassified Aliivibrio]MDD9155373.1 DUF3103 domain-containing protein [Aliivibrio sp. S4TY2]MDD9159075.1 DUF3103 domain-containing protein [Aliivibrio sp. S4TY1]MDD9163375.1 DUF3103 domain-containing protein [Aliivibrio sp. S4MY2]MDD9167074.1 DUF3103 domain-containing protein [Aliivibrio sp. S4MY4]MDD9184452.1 DUF3103 domain-containing protein [Aliivibrio sp. S4MY3]